MDVAAIGDVDAFTVAVCVCEKNDADDLAVTDVDAIGVICDICLCM